MDVLRIRAAMTAISAVTLLMLSGTAFAQADATVFLDAPTQLPQVGETFEVSLYVTDGDTSVVSYALRVLYDPRVLNITEIRGGKDPVYSADPLSNMASYTKGYSDFTAVKAGDGETPDTYQIARIRFSVVGENAAPSPIRIQTSPTGGLVDEKHFSLLRAQLPPALYLTSAN